LRTLFISFFTVVVFFITMEDTIVYLLSSDDSKVEMTKETEKEEKRESKEESEIDEKIEFCNEINVYKLAELNSFSGHKQLELKSLRNNCLLPVITPPPERSTIV